MCVKSCCFSTFLSKVPFWVWMKCMKLQLQLVLFLFKGLVFIIHLSIFPLFSFFLLLLALLQCSRSLLLFLPIASFVAALLFVLFSIWSLHLVALSTLLTYFLHTKLCFLGNNDLLFLLFKTFPLLYLDLLFYWPCLPRQGYCVYIHSRV